MTYKKKTGKERSMEKWERAHEQRVMEFLKKKKDEKKKTIEVLDGGAWVAIGNEIIPKNWPNFDEAVAHCKRETGER